MCGINGLYDFKEKIENTECWELVHQMNEKIIYRGPNHEGMYQHGGLTMGMRRLSVQDLSYGNQPIYNETKELAVVFNGEIYNFQELRKGLEEKGHKFKNNWFCGNVENMNTRITLIPRESHMFRQKEAISNASTTVGSIVVNSKPTFFRNSEIQT